MSDSDFLAAWRANPFFVLEVKTDAARIEIERAGQRLLARFEISPDSVARYQTPLGPGVRDADMVRQALAALRDPVQRVTCELWADVARIDSALLEDDKSLRWVDAERALGWAGK
ncbi:MAG TPA: hypothetical protein VF472_25850 [Burkholderiaceae bacterium]